MIVTFNGLNTDKIYEAKSIFELITCMDLVKEFNSKHQILLERIDYFVDNQYCPLAETEKILTEFLDEFDNKYMLHIENGLIQVAEFKYSKTITENEVLKAVTDAMIEENKEGSKI